MSKILIIEDDKSNREIYASVLKEAGYDIDTAGDGETGLLKAQAGGYDLILLDVMLPRMDGLTVLTELKKTPPKIKNGKIVILSNLSHEPIIKQALTLGANSSIVKSDVNPGQLVEAVKKFLTPNPKSP
jgi:two-component system chemotaxis response regulator CheY